MKTFVFLNRAEMKKKVGGEDQISPIGQEFSAS